MKHLINLLPSFMIITFLTSCATTPTGRRQLRYLPESQMAQMGEAAFVKMKSGGKTVPASQKDFTKVRCIVDRLLVQMDMKPADWKVEVFKDPSPNAFALPGKNIGVHTGMIELTANDDQLAAVIGHEIAHVLAHHGNERASQQMLVQGGLTAAQAYLGNDSATDKTLMGVLGMGAQVGVLLPFSRKHETEADEMGIKYMAKAGFDPEEASELWKLMDKKSGGGAGTPEFMSTHPSSPRRAKNLDKKADSLSEIYQQSKTNTKSCG